MRDVEPKFLEQIGYHVDGDLGKAVAIAEKADVWRLQGRGDRKDEEKKPGGSGRQG